ncbi:MAG: hypothetical protein FWD90_01090 [Defluviitaleaceae bacterium]|nr:hypothetical protein [Defluviitaleaceae bacterium]
MKVIKKVLLWLLCFIVFILLSPIILLLLFAPFRYAVVARRLNGKTTVRVKASYLFRLITAHYVYKEGKSLSHIRIAGFLIGSGKKKPPEDIKSKEPAPLPAEPLTDVESVTDAEPAVNAEPSPDPEPLRQGSEPSPPQRESGRNLRSILTYPELKTIIRLTLLCMKKTVKALLPKRLDISGALGFDDPAATAMFIGYYEAAASFLNLREKVRISADFAESGIRYKVSAAGRFSMAGLSRPVLRLLLKKPIRKFIGFLRG